MALEANFQRTGDWCCEPLFRSTRSSQSIRNNCCTTSTWSIVIAPPTSTMPLWMSAFSAGKSPVLTKHFGVSQNQMVHHAPKIKWFIIIIIRIEMAILVGNFGIKTPQRQPGERLPARHLAPCDIYLAVGQSRALSPCSALYLGYEQDDLGQRCKGKSWENREHHGKWWDSSVPNIADLCWWYLLMVVGNFVPHKSPWKR